jgi:hypothetical protein
MLTTQSYLMALALYWIAAIGGIWLLRRLWFSESIGRGAAALLGAMAGLLLAPAFPGEGSETVAPALIVVVFNALFWEGLASAAWPGVWLAAGAIAGAIAGLWLRSRGMSAGS